MFSVNWKIFWHATPHVGHFECMLYNYRYGIQPLRYERFASCKSLQKDSFCSKILLKLGAFYHNLLKIHPIHVIWAPSSLMKTYQISRNSTWKGRHIYDYVNVRTSPDGVTYAVIRMKKRSGKEKERRNSGGGKRQEWTFEFDRHHIWSWWTDL